MKTRLAGCLTALGLLFPALTAAQCGGNACDLRVLSAVLGYGSARISDIGVPERVMHGGNARIDLHLASLLLRNLPLRTYDALIADVSYGRRTSSELTGLFPGDVEGGTGFQATFGYQFLAGKQFGGVALLGGLGVEERYTDIGGTTLSGRSTPLIARVELGARRPIVLTAWQALNGDHTTGGRVDVPFFRRLNLTAMAWRADGQADVWNDTSGNKIAARGTLLVLGVRTAEVR
jgi:hypothetical protein